MQNKNNETRKTNKPKAKKNPSQKRNVVAVKVFMTPEEKQTIENKVGDFKSIKSLSNIIRYHLGLPSNSIGRQKKLND